MSPANNDNMSPPPSRTSSSDSAADAIRKRVCKACDRCRMKKSKCDGSSPCSRCKADNAICVFGERKKSHDKVYPKGYVEMLEQQQSQLVAGLQEMYRRALVGQSWSGHQLSEANGHPLTHDILAALNLLESKGDGSGEFESFEEDCSKLQSRLLASGAPYVQRRGSVSSDSDHSQHSHSRTASQSTPKTASKNSTTTTTNNNNNNNNMSSSGSSRAASLREYQRQQMNHHTNLGFTPSPSPLSQSPVPQAQPLFSQPPPPPPINTSRSSPHMSHVNLNSANSNSSHSPLSSVHSPAMAGADPQFYQSAWAMRSSSTGMSNPGALLRNKYALQIPELNEDANSLLLQQQQQQSQQQQPQHPGSSSNDDEDVVLDDDFLDAASGWVADDMVNAMDFNGMFGSFVQTPFGAASMRDPFAGAAMDPMELDLNRAVPVVT